MNKVRNLIPKEKMAVHIPTDVEKQIEKYRECAIKCLGMDTMAILEYNKESLKNAKF